MPADILLAEFGDNSIISRFGLPFYTVNQNPYQMGLAAVELLTSMIDNDKLSSKRVNKKVKYNIIFRNPGVQNDLFSF